MNWNPTQPPKSDIAARLARTSEAERRMPRRTSGAAVLRSCATKPARIAATTANEPRVRADPQPASGAPTSVNTSSSIAAVIPTAPATSNLREPPDEWALRGTSRRPAASVSSATGTGRKNTQRQPISVRSPPNTSPSEKPVAPVAVYTDRALLRAGPSANVVVMIDRPAGAVNAALTPL